MKKKDPVLEANKSYVRNILCIINLLEDFSNYLLKWGYKLNPYDQCVVNKNLNGKQSTILWNVDNLKLSHVDTRVNEVILDKLTEKFGKLRTTRGEQHVFLGMQLIFFERGMLCLSIIKYLEEALEKLPKEIKLVAVILASKKALQN